MEEVLKTSEEWVKETGHQVLDPDGWDRKNFDYSWSKEKITKQEFNRRLMFSTILMNNTFTYNLT